MTQTCSGRKSPFYPALTKISKTPFFFLDKHHDNIMLWTCHMIVLWYSLVHRLSTMGRTILYMVPPLKPKNSVRSLKC